MKKALNKCLEMKYISSRMTLNPGDNSEAFRSPCLGNVLNKRVSQKTFRAIVLAVILIIGINLLIKI